jgi:hypothetical protein
LNYSAAYPEYLGSPSLQTGRPKSKIPNKNRIPFIKPILGDELNGELCAERGGGSRWAPVSKANFAHFNMALLSVG